MPCEPALPGSSGRRDARRARPSAARAAGSPAGFTLLEMMIVVIAMAVIAALATPKISGFRSRAQLNSARQQMAATVDAARSAAIQRGRPAWVRRVGNRLIAEVDTAPRGVTAPVMRVMVAGPMDTLFNAVIDSPTPHDTAVRWDGRGFAMPRPAQTIRFVVTNKAGRDSVCISRVGIILPRRCLP